MKKLLLVLTVMLFANVARAEGFGVVLGVKAGYQTSVLSLNKADIQTGFSENLTLGAFGRVTIGKTQRFVFQPELLWFKSGQVFDINTDDGLFSPKLEMSQQNMALPLLFGCQYQIDIPFLKLFNLRWNLGPVMYFVVDQTNKCTLDDSSLKLEADANSMTWGGLVNVGVDVLCFSLDINYSFGLTDLFDQETVTVPGTSSTVTIDQTKRSLFTVTIGWKIFDWDF